jgi:hypothetical protein
MLNSTAHQKLATVKPGTIALVRRTSTALITIVNSPRVIMLIGRVKKIISGLTNELISPSTKAATTAAINPSTSIPGSKYAKIRIINAVISHLNNISFILISVHLL